MLNTVSYLEFLVIGENGGGEFIWAMLLSLIQVAFLLMLVTDSWFPVWSRVC